MKPRLLIIDWKPETIYYNISDIVDIVQEIEFPEKIDEFSGVILHGVESSEIERIMPYILEKRIPIILIQPSEWMRIFFYSRGYCNHKNLYEFHDYEDLFSKAREIFG